jgi:hypothetical protein
MQKGVPLVVTVAWDDVSIHRRHPFLNSPPVGSLLAGFQAPKIESTVDFPSLRVSRRDSTSGAGARVQTPDKSQPHRLMPFSFVRERGLRSSPRPLPHPGGVAYAGAAVSRAAVVPNGATRALAPQ